AEHQAAQLLVALARLHLQRRARIALQVAHLLGLRIRPDPDGAAPHDVPERHQVREAVAAVGRADHGALLVEEGQRLLVGHGDLCAAVRHALGASRPSAAASTAPRASAGSSTTASPASLSTSRTRYAVPL